MFETRPWTDVFRRGLDLAEDLHVAVARHFYEVAAEEVESRFDTTV